MSTKFNHIIEDPGSFYLFASLNSEEICFKFSLHPWSMFNPQAQSKMVPAVSSKRYPEKNNNKQQLHSAYCMPAFYIH